jgi:hypothetical protein
MDNFQIFIYVIFAVKIGFILMAITNIYLKHKGREGDELYEKINYWKERFEFIFVFLMSILLIYLFNNRTSKTVLISGETKLLLFLFGIVLIITAKWSVFFKESKLFKEIKSSLGDEESK